MNTVTFVFSMGSTVRDRVTGFEGVVISATAHITGCNQYAVSPGLNKDGDIRDFAWFDEDRLKAVEPYGAVKEG